MNSTSQKKVRLGLILQTLQGREKMRRIFAVVDGKLVSSNPPTIAYSNSYSFFHNRNHSSVSDSFFGSTAVDRRCLNDEDSNVRAHSLQHQTPLFLPIREIDKRWLRHTGRKPRHHEFAADVEKIYEILKTFHSRVSKLELALQESGVVVRSGLTERVWNRFGWDEGILGYRFFAWASKQPGYRPNHEVYRSMIDNFRKMRQFGPIWALIDEIRRENPQLITPHLFVVLMRRFPSARMVKKAVEVLDNMTKYGCDDTHENVFVSLLDALCKNGKTKEAALLFEDMRVRFRPTIRHFTSLLYGWCNEGKLLEAKFLLVQMKNAGIDPDVVQYNYLLNGYVQARKMVYAFDLLQEMRKKGCDPNTSSFTILIQAFCVKKKMNPAMQVFFLMEQHGCEADAVIYTMLIGGYCELGKTIKAYKLLDSMIQKGHTPNQTMYLHILKAHEKRYELKDCLELLNEMQKIGCHPDLEIYNTIIRLAFKSGEVEEGVRVWNQMEASGLRPGLDNFVTTVRGLINQESFVVASEYFKQMVERGLLSNEQYGLLKDLLDSLLRDDKIEVSKDVWSCLVNKGCELNVYAWTNWIHALFTYGYVEDACFYFVEMLDADVMPQSDTFAMVMKALRKPRYRLVAAVITEKVRQMAAERNVTFKMYKRRGVHILKQ